MTDIELINALAPEVTRDIEAERWMSYYILNDQNEPVQVAPEDPAALKFGRGGSRRVALDKVGEYRVSTIFLCLDHGIGVGPPVLWETMIFGGDRDEECHRYTSSRAAAEGHAKIVRSLRDA